MSTETVPGEKEDDYTTGLWVRKADRFLFRVTQRVMVEITGTDGEWRWVTTIRYVDATDVLRKTMYVQSLERFLLAFERLPIPTYLLPTSSN